MSETDKDIENVEAWAEIIEDMLHLMPAENRIKVLRLALQKEEAEVKDREKNGLYRVVAFDEISMNSPGLMHWNAIMRLKSLIVQIFVRNITNDHSREEAGRILFTNHRYGHGSRSLSEYIDDLPRRAEGSEHP
jgi:hypothetical protein